MGNLERQPFGKRETPPPPPPPSVGEHAESVSPFNPEPYKAFSHDKEMGELLLRHEALKAFSYADSVASDPKILQKLEADIHARYIELITKH